MKVDSPETFCGDFDLLKYQVMEFRNEHPDHSQFCITSKLGNNNFFEGAGTCNCPEEYTKLNSYFQDSEISRLVDRYPDYYRWRILCVGARKTYSIHHDAWKTGFKNVRIHVPIITNEESFLVFYENKLMGNGAQRIEHHNLQTNKIYLVDTSGYHTAVNYHASAERIHIVAERFISHEQ